MTAETTPASEPIDWRQQVLNRLGTFADDVDWIGIAADWAFADSIRALAEYAIASAVREEREKVLAIHRPVPSFTNPRFEHCDECRVDWPCATAAVMGVQ